MDRQEIVEALRRDMVETGSLICLGCGHEHHCGTQGCAVLRAAADLIETLARERDPYDLISENNDLRVTIAIKQKNYDNLKRERDAAVRDCSIHPCYSCLDWKYHISERCKCCDNYSKPPYGKSKHVWRGVCAENGG